MWEFFFLLEQVAQASCGVSILGDAQNPGAILSNQLVLTLLWAGGLH